MILGPLTIRWTKKLRQEISLLCARNAKLERCVYKLSHQNTGLLAEQARTQRISMRQNRVIAGLSKDNQAMRHTLERIVKGGSSRAAKTPTGAGAVL